MSNTGRLYMAVHVYDETAEAEDDNTEPLAEWERELLGVTAPEPIGWRAYALDMWGTEPREGEHWPNGHKPFFFPKTGVPYKSRSTAQRRVDIINYWGGKAEVLECTPRWESLEAANKRRETMRLNARKARLLEQVADLDEKLWAVAP